MKVNEFFLDQDSLGPARRKVEATAVFLRADYGHGLFASELAGFSELG